MTICSAVLTASGSCSGANAACRASRSAATAGSPSLQTSKISVLRHARVPGAGRLHHEGPPVTLGVVVELRDHVPKPVPGVSLQGSVEGTMGHLPALVIMRLDILIHVREALFQPRQILSSETGNSEAYAERL